MKLEYSRQILKEYSNVKCHENSSSKGRVVAFGQTDWHDEVKSRFSQFFESSYVLNTNFGFSY